MQDELKSLMNNFENKWKPMFKKAKENGEDLYKFYRKNSCELLEDLSPIADMCYMIEALKRIGIDD